MKQTSQKEKEESTKNNLEMAGSDGNKDPEKLPPGFRFHPTDEELITFYLINKITDATFTGRAIGDVDLNKCEPWELPAKAKMGEKEWYFFSLRDRKYPTGVRTNRATNTGYWKTTGKDKEIFNSVTSELVGMKKTLVFYRGRAPRGEKTNWVMHEYRIHSKSAFRTSKDEWVVCRVFQKSAGAKKYPTSQARTVINPYALETGPSMLPSPLMPLGDPTQFLFSARNNYGAAITTPELAELSRVFRAAAAAGGSSTTTMMNLPIPSSQFNYPAAMAGGGAPGGCLSISGLNLNLGSPPVQPVFRPLQPPPPPMNLNQHHDQIAASMISTTSGTSFALDQSGSSTGYGTDMNNVPNNNGPTIRPYMNVDHCMDLDNYWPAY